MNGVVIQKMHDVNHDIGFWSWIIMEDNIIVLNLCCKPFQVTHNYRLCNIVRLSSDFILHVPATYKLCLVHVITVSDCV